jgi:hypothetical protein
MKMYEEENDELAVWALKSKHAMLQRRKEKKELKRIERLKLQHVNKMECGAVVVNSNNTTAPSISPIRIKKRIAPVVVEADVANAVNVIDGVKGVKGVDGVNVMDGIEGVSELSKEEKRKRKRKAKRLKMQENVLMQQKLNLINEKAMVWKEKIVSKMLEITNRQYQAQQQIEAKGKNKNKSKGKKKGVEVDGGDGDMDGDISQVQSLSPHEASLLLRNLTSLLKESNEIVMLLTKDILDIVDDTMRGKMDMHRATRSIFQLMDVSNGVGSGEEEEQ